MRLFFKSLGWLILLVLLFLALVLAVLAYQPQWLISAYNGVQDDWQLEAPEIDIDLLPPALDVPDLQLQGTGTSVHLVGAVASLNPSAWWQEQPFWRIEAQQADVELIASAPVQEEPAGTLTIPDIAQFLTFSNVQINKVNLSGDTSLTAELNAERADGVVNLSAQTTIDSATYAVTGVISENENQRLDLVLDATALDSTSDSPLTLDAHIEAALTRPGGAVALAISTGAVSANVAGAQHEVQALSGSAVLAAGGETIQLEEFAGSYLGAPLEQPVDFQVDGEVGLAGTMRDADVQVQFGASSLTFAGQYAADFSAVTGEASVASTGLPDAIELAPYASDDLFPATIQTSLNYAANPVQLALTELVVETPANALAGELDFTLADAPVLHANLLAERLYVPLTPADGGEGADNNAEEGAVAEVIAEEVSGGEVADEPSASDNDKDKDDDKERLFATTAIDWSWLDSAEIDAQLKAKELRLEDARFMDFAVRALNKDGALELSPLQATLGDGGFTGGATLSKTTDSDAVDAGFELDVQGISLEAFGFVPQDQLSGGALEVGIALTSSGNSAADLAAGLNGDIQLMVEDAKLLNDFVELAGSDLLLEVLNKINPFAKSDPTTELNCALVKFKATDGKLETKNQLVMETSKMEIVGSGSVDLNDEKLSITITPNAKSGIGLNVGSLVKFLKLGGTLSSPRPAADAAGLLKSGLAIGAAISTGGASIVAEGLAKRATAGQSACVEVREESEKESEKEKEIEPS